MDWIFVLKEVLGWAIPLLCAAIMAKTLAPLKKAKTAQERGQELIDQETWDNRSKGLVDRIEKLEEHHNQDVIHLEQEATDLRTHDTDIDSKLAEILSLLKASTEANQKRFDAMDEKNTAAFLQIYQRDLIVDGKSYIQYKRITPQQLANYEKRYKQYKDWGGNGDVEPWIKKIRELPIYYPTVQDFNDK